MNKIDNFCNNTALNLETDEVIITYPDGKQVIFETSRKEALNFISDINIQIYNKNSYIFTFYEDNDVIIFPSSDTDECFKHISKKQVGSILIKLNSELEG